jgi:hypothetical protein
MHRTAQQDGYHANLAAINETDDDHQNLAAAAHEFAAAEASRQTTVTQLATTNTDLHGQLVNLATHNQHLQQQMTQMQQQYVFLATQQQRRAPAHYPSYQGRGRGRGAATTAHANPHITRVWAQATLPTKVRYPVSPHTQGHHYPAPPRQGHLGNRHHPHGGPPLAPRHGRPTPGPQCHGRTPPGPQRHGKPPTNKTTWRRRPGTMATSKTPTNSTMATGNNDLPMPNNIVT